MDLQKMTTNKWLQLAIVLTAPMLYVIDIFIINISIPTIKANLNASDGEMQLVVSAYLLGSASFLIIGARTGDYLGKKRVFFWGMFWFTFTSCLCGLCINARQLIIARFLQGVSSAFMVTQCISYIQELFPNAAERAKAIGWYGITLSIAAIIGQILGGYLAETHLSIAGWRLIFLINLPIGIFSMLMIKKYLIETERVNNIRFDYLGALMLAVSLGGIIYVLSIGREQSWPGWSFFLLIFSFLLLMMFLVVQMKLTKGNRTPILDLKLFLNKEFNYGLMAVLFHFMLHAAYLLIIAVFLQSGQGVSAISCGMYFLPHALLFMISSIVASKLLTRWGKRVLQTGLLIILISFLLQLCLFNEKDNPVCTMFLIGIYGLGNGMVLPFLLNIVLNNIALENAAMASGIFSTFQQIASALGISIISGIFYYKLQHPEVAAAYVPALRLTFYVDVVCLMVVILMLWRLPGKLGARE
ncbi:MFS transporter [Niastella sp. OAS944]|uniref:MFS transporter n=1 Tax=Niastella sp. OAS944 TaxID=2664089 RepID=UPI00348D9091|nr:EmrB/QacA subfamily drug resistance transporter [Chitinophagaceae bacterium OAS944]